MRSDALPLLRTFALMANGRAQLIRLQRPVVAVVDTNFIFSAARTKLRLGPEIRMAFEEVAESGAIVFGAPDVLDFEVRDKALEVCKGSKEEKRRGRTTQRTHACREDVDRSWAGGRAWWGQLGTASRRR